MTSHARLSEDARQLAHIAAGSAALLLRVLSWWEALLIISLALLFNLYGLPHLAGGSLMRERETSRRWSSGVVLYPLSLIALLLALPDRPDIVAASWAVLAVGDGMATLVGRRLVGPRIPWNREKSVAGTLAFFVCGSIAAAALCWWCRPAIIPPPYWWFSLGAPILATLAAALVETIPIRLNDNLSVPWTAAAVLWSMSLVSQDLARDAWQSMSGPMPLALALNALLAGAGVALRVVSVSGAISGAFIGAIILLTTGWGGWSLLLLTFGSAVVASRAGLDTKTRLGIAQEHEGRRGAGSAVANTGVAAVAGLMAVLTYAHEPALIACAAALVAGSSDSIASEIGKAWGGRTRLFPAWRVVAPGTPGGLSVIGTCAGLAGALALGGAAIPAGLIGPDSLLAVVAGATAGSLVESALAARLEPHLIVNNDVLNFLNTAVAAAAAVWIAG